MNYHQLLPKQSGFTLIELVIVIVLLGILSATALPKFLDLTKETEQAVFDTNLGSVKSAVKMYHLQWRAKGQPDSAFGIFSSIPSEQGYPAGGSNLATAFESDCDIIWYDLLQDNAPSLGFITGSNGWSASVSNDDWVRNGSQLSVIGETEDIYCHFVYIKAYFGGFSGELGDRVPTIQYNIITGEVAAIGWPYSP
ncbi:hypothetical protein A9Q74_14955 [Colwellia sp. 39_35_sub15_T18]|nr:hypothetical protein A9Q74_14955 [Colwellia sp. 39_35_sub15_T18]